MSVPTQGSATASTVSSLSSLSSSTRSSRGGLSPPARQRRQQQQQQQTPAATAVQPSPPAQRAVSKQDSVAAGAVTELAGRGAATHVRLNPQLRFERRDNEYIALPPLRDVQHLSLTLRRLMCDREGYPEGRHRMLDYFRVAVEMFVAQLRSEYVQQYRTARQQGRSLARFTWRNKGELAICYACCCDTLKLLYDTLQPGPLKPLWDAFVQQLFPLLMSESGVPSSVLTLHTYHTKFMDWQKGGTRYHGDQSATNVRFPSALERRAKIETYLRSGAGYKLEAVSVQAPPPPTTPTPPQATTATAPTNTTTTAASATAAATTTMADGTAAMRADGRPAPGPAPRPPLLSSVLAGSKVPSAVVRTALRLPVRVAVKGIAGAHVTSMMPPPPPPSALPAPQRADTDGDVTPASVPPELRHLQWLSTLAHITGSSDGDAFPDERAQLMPAFVRVCETTEVPQQMRLLIDTVAASSERMQMLFERLGGMVAMRRLAAQLIHASNSVLLMHLIEQLVRMRLHTWGATSQQAWRTNHAQRLTGDLTWLRSEASIPAHKRAAWGAMVLLMEHKYIFSAPRSDTGDDGNDARKRARASPAYPCDVTPASTPSAEAADMTRWQLPRVNTLLALRLPYDVAAPTLAPLPPAPPPPFAAEASAPSSSSRHDADEVLHKKRTFAERTQVTWEQRLRAVLQDNHVGVDAVRIPLWYDPYQLLDTEQPTA